MKPIALNYLHRQAGLVPKVEDGCITTPAFIVAFKVGKQGQKEMTDIICLFYSCVLVYNINFVRFEFYENGNLNNPIAVHDMPVGDKDVGAEQVLHIVEEKNEYIPELFIKLAS
jgi:hypothetical protein